MKKILIIALSLLLAVGVLISCTGNNGNTNGDIENEIEAGNPENSENETEEPSEEENKEPAEEPIEEPTEEPTEEPVGEPEPEQIPSEENTETDAPVVNTPEVEAPPTTPETETPEETPEADPIAPEAPSQGENLPTETPEENTPAELPEENLPEEEMPEDNPVEEEWAGSELAELIENIYADKRPQFMLGTMAVNLEDEFMLSNYLGLTDASAVEEAAVSEAMIGSQAYSLVIVKVKEGEDPEAVAQAMKAGIDPRKWICVEADDIKVATKGNLVCFCMIDSEYAEDYTAQDAIDAFLAKA